MSSGKFDTAISNIYDNDFVEKSTLRSKRNGAVQSVGKPKTFHTSHSMPVFSPDKNSSICESPPQRSSSVSKAKALEPQSQVSADTDEILAKLGAKTLATINSSVLLSDETLKSSYEDLLNIQLMRKMAGSNEELSTKEKKMDKKQKLKLAAMKSKKPQSFDEFSLNGEAGTEPLKKRSLLSKFRKK